MTTNLSAFLAMIAHAEGTDRVIDPYKACYGYVHIIQDLNWHPAETRPDGTREWAGESIAHLGPQYKGEVSTAAGRYQIRLHTWINVKAALRLSDFTPTSQDDAAIYLIRGRGALNDVTQGHIADAIVKCRQEWASLPGSDAAGQPHQTLTALLHAYTLAGGVSV